MKYLSTDTLLKVFQFHGLRGVLYH